MLKELTKRLLSLTPYQIIKRKNQDSNTKTNFTEFDPLAHNSPQEMDRIFSQEGFLEKYNSEHRNKLYDKIIEYVPDDKKNVVDFGCGPGFCLKALIDKRPSNKYFGYDQSKVVVELANRLCPQAMITIHDIRENVLSKYDIAICSQTLEHILYPEVVLKNIISSVTTQGIVILTVPDGRKDQYKGHINFWSELSWQAWIETNIENHSKIKYDRVTNEIGFDFLIAVINL